MRLYHLLAARWAIDDLERRRLKVARFADLNDPFELLALELSDPDDRHAYNCWRDRAAEAFGLLCFSRTWRSPVLWSHYGDSHRGLCLGFDVPDASVRRVEYLKKRVPFRSLVPTSLDAIQTPGPLFHMKFEDWSYEREWRRIVSLSDAQPDNGHRFWSFGVDLALREVIVGARSDVSGERLRQAIGGASDSVPIIQARPAFRSFGVVVQQRGIRHRRHNLSRRVT